MALLLCIIVGLLLAIPQAAIEIGDARRRMTAARRRACREKYRALGR